MSNLASTSKNHSKKVNSRDKNKSVPSESGGSSQCDTPPLNDKNEATSQGKFAGVGVDSVLCMAEQVGAELTTEAATNLAEDVSYKLRHAISTIALHVEMMKKSRLESTDVNMVLGLGDNSPIVGASTSQYVSIGDDKICQTDCLVNVPEFALTPQSYAFSTLPTVSVEWITDEKSLNSSGNISSSLQNYYTKVARAILNLRKKPKEIAVEDLTTNTRIGPIFPNLFNLAVLVLNDDNLNALNVPAKKPLQLNVLDMADALCSNPCSLDTNIQQQFQRLFPVMVSNILGNGSLAEKMVSILTKITRTWPSFIAIGESMLFEYLSQCPKERLTAPMIRCVTALGRRALRACLADHLDHIDACIHAPRKSDLRETILDASTSLLRSEPTTYLEDFVTTDYTLYEMLGDSILPRRTLFPYIDKTTAEETNAEKPSDEELTYTPQRPITRRPKVRLISTEETLRNQTRVIPLNRDSVFDLTDINSAKSRTIRVHIKNCRSKDIPRVSMVVRNQNSMQRSRASRIVVGSGVLSRFKFRLSRTNSFPILGALSL